MTREVVTAELEQLAATFRKNREAAAASVERAVMHAIAAGEALIEAKKQIRHGGWLSWLKINCDISERTARSYMQLARAPLEERQRVADLPLREALATIATRRRYRLPCCDTPVPCSCGADFVMIDEHGAIVERVPVIPL